MLPRCSRAQIALRGPIRCVRVSSVPEQRFRRAGARRSSNLAPEKDICTSNGRQQDGKQRRYSASCSRAHPLGSQNGALQNALDNQTMAVRDRPG